MSAQTPQTDAIRTMLHKKYAGNFTGSRKLLYYMEAAECYGQECAVLEIDRDRLKALCEELREALKYARLFMDKDSNFPFVDAALKKAGLSDLTSS